MNDFEHLSCSHLRTRWQMASCKRYRNRTICRCRPKERVIVPTSAAVQAFYQDTVLGVDCKPYFEHYYGRMRDYYDRQDEKAAKTLLRTLANDGALKRESCYHLYRAKCEGADIERSNCLMANLENDFYVGFNSRQGAYQFLCKLLRELRHYRMEG